MKLPSNKIEPKQQPTKSKLEKEVEKLAEEVITGKRKEIGLNERGLKNVDGLGGMTTIY